MSCTNGQTEKRMLASAQPSREESVKPPRSLAREESSQPARSSPPRVAQRQSWPFQRAMVLGMSDDEVLNLPGWGRPSRIIRTRVPREWREEWIYAGATSAERRLHFVNAALVEIIEQPTSDDPAPREYLASSD